MQKVNFGISIIINIISIITLLVLPLGGLLPVATYSHIRYLHKQQQSASAFKGNNQKTIFNGLSNTKVVILTFGDGYKSQYIYAKPILDKYDFKANFFVTCNRVGADNSQMSWQEIVQLYKEGHTIGSHSNLMYLHCDGWKHDSSQTDCRTYFDNGSLTFANRYSIREWRMQHIEHGNSYNNSQMFGKFIEELNSQNKFNQNGTINASPIIGYHNIITSPDVSDTNESSATTLNLFDAEMK